MFDFFFFQKRQNRKKMIVLKFQKLDGLYDYEKKNSFEFASIFLLLRMQQEIYKEWEFLSPRRMTSQYPIIFYFFKFALLNM